MFALPARGLLRPRRLQCLDLVGGVEAECEIANFAGMPPGKRKEALDGVTGSQGRAALGSKDIPGEEAVARLRAEIDRCAALKRV